MALRDQPYLPLFVQDFLTDEKLNECSAESTGVYIKLMCIMHKSDKYGTILLKQKDKQTQKQIENFAIKITRLLPFPKEIIENSLKELIDEGVLTLEGDMLFQKRMVKDNELSNIRASAGRKGGNKKVNANSFAKAKGVANGKANNMANTEIENEYENDTENDINNKFTNEVFADCARFLENEFCNVVSPSIYEKMFNAIDEFGVDIVKLAITESVAQEKRYWNYTEAILNNWRGQNINTLSQAQKAISNFRVAKSTKGNRSSTLDVLADIIAEEEGGAID